ncbi:protease Lon-related BREX system protein BrxL [Fusobacterium ulcerans]|uniref:protease Lon-related BREX system protein BrxL n=1 Tax=Fusobacterium ulcerans TaxID=861 RepID=UPI0026DA9ED1|nr:protease Lon-related BREX system protein BrxL [Fusobacterium ulcerans]
MFNEYNHSEDKIMFEDETSSNEVINKKLRQYFDGKIVRKDLTKSIKEGANVPIYVLEFLLGQYCSSDDAEIIEDGVKTVKKILSENFVRPDEAQKVLSNLRERGSYTVIDRITAKLNIKEDRYEAEFSNLGIKGILLEPEYVSKYDRLLCGGIWCIVQLEYEYMEEDKRSNPIRVRKLTPIQMPHIELSEIKEARGYFTKEEWISILLRSTGMEADKFTDREKWLLLARMIPLVENNFNLCELGPRSTGKSHIYKEISPNSILVSGGQTTVANLFYNMASKTVGLVGMWDCVAFDEVAGITFKDKDGIQIMKDYMASGSFARGKEEKAASASMVFVGNINQSVDVLLKTSHLFEPFPEAMAYDTAFLDRMHCYVPGWEIPKYRPDFFTNEYGFITDYLSEFMREMRKEQFSDVSDKFYRFGSNLNQRDVIAVRKTISGFTKLLYPNADYTKEDIAEIITVALELRRRVKEQMKKIGGMEFYDVNFSFIDIDTFEEHYVSVPEQGGGKLVPEGILNPGNLYTVSRGKTGMVGVYRLETQVLPGNGKFERTGLGTDREAKEATNTALNYLKANANSISSSISTTTKDYIINYSDLQGIGMTKYLTLPTVIAICSSALGKPTLSSLAVLGDISISGTILKVEELASVLQVCLDSGVKKVLLPITSAVDMAAVPAELMGAFSIIFYNTPQEAVFKALGVD